MIEIKNLNGDVIYTHEGDTLENADLENADLENADLAGAILTDAILEHANLTGAILENANLNGAYLTGAILTGANLTGAKLQRVCDMIVNNDGSMMNTRLIAAAPELLEWLKKILAEVDAGNCETPETSRWQEAHAVIAKTDTRKE